MNLAKQVRDVLDLTPTEAGQLFFGYRPKQAYDTWSKWENGAREIPLSTKKYFELILALEMMRRFKTPGAEKALDIFISTLRS